MREDPVDDLVRQIQPLRDPGRLLVVPEAVMAMIAEGAVERSLSRMSERRMPHVVAEADRLGQVLVQPESARNDPRDPGRLERVRHARAVVVARRVDEDLRLPLQPPERLRMQDPIAVALKGRPDRAGLLVELPAARLVRAHRKRRQCGLLALALARREGVADFPGKLRHRGPG